MRDRFRDPLGWLLDALPWPARRVYLAVRLRELPWNVPDDCRIIGCRRPSSAAVAYFRRLHGLD
jgi:hypothetical protein